MGDEKYEQLLERSVIAQEKNNNFSEALIEVSKNLENNVRELNDKFVLHCTNADNITTEVKAIRTELLKYLKWAILALVIVLGGQRIVEILSNYIK